MDKLEDKLNQLDRIEYKVDKANNSSEYYSGIIFASVFGNTAIVTAIFLSLIMIIRGIFEQYKFVVVGVLVIGLAYMIFICLIFSVSYMKETKKLKNKYFSMELRKRSK